MSAAVAARPLRAALLVVLGVGLAGPVAPAVADEGWGVEQARPAAPDGEVAAAPRVAETTASMPTWRLSGAGWGHGVGMSQYGAQAMAVAGRSAAEILGHYYTGTDYTLASDTSVVSVNVQHEVSSTTLQPSALSSGGGTMTLTVGAATLTGAAGTTATVTPTSTGVTVSCPGCSGATSATGTSLTATWDDGRTLLSVGGTRYRDGSLAVTRSPSSSTLEVVVKARMHDEYLDYIREVPWSWEPAALEAQAAAARGYALRAMSGGIRSACACHVYDTTTSQVFGGYPSGADLTYWAAWRAAVRAAGSSTKGYVATYDGSIIESVYSSSTGGRTQNSEDVWGGTVAYLRSVDDPWSLTSANPRRAWELRPATSTVAARFGLPDVTRLDLSSRYVSGAVRTATATASTGETASLSGAAFAARLGLYSTYVARPTQRFGGEDRYAVAAGVAASRLQSASTVVVASGADGARADAAVSGPLAQALGAPLLLTAADRLPAATVAELDRRGSTPTRAVVVGGRATVSDAVVEALADRGLEVTRIGGADRYALSAAVARRVAVERSVTAAVPASGRARADALGAGGPAGALGEPVLLTRAASLPPSVAAAVDDLGLASARVLGGASSVSEAVEADLDARVGDVDRIGGADRYAVAAAVGAYYAPRLSSVTAVSVASGADTALTDALTAGSLGRITLLVRASGLPWQSAAALQRLPAVARVDAVGGPVSVPSAVLTAAAQA